MTRGTKSVKNAKINHEVSGKSKEEIIHNILREFGFRVIREYTIRDERFQQKRKERTCDFRVTFGPFSTLMESDGPVHGDFETQTLSTRKRNQDFKAINANLVLLNHDTIKYLLQQFQEKEKLSCATFTDILEFLAVYRSLEEYAKSIE